MEQSAMGGRAVSINPVAGRGIWQGMIFSKSLTFDSDELDAVGVANDHCQNAGNAETQFIERLKSGDPEAFDSLVDRYGNAVFGMLLRITGDREEASDLTQETFIRAIKGIAKFRGDAGLKTWLFRIAINQSKNRFRWWKRRKKDKTFSIDAPIGESETAFADVLESNVSNPLDDVLEKERSRKLITAIEQLPTAYRETIVLCDIQGLSYEEIAEVLDINIGTVKSRIARGRHELRSKLSDF
ncbi:MAG: sigma-70 family RNA polymerase sigma factor [Pyrinomonadaceae bacterium]